MEKVKLMPYVDMLNKAPKNEHEQIVAELAKENNVKTKDMWKLLKDAGFGQKTDSPAAQQPGDGNDADSKTDSQTAQQSSDEKKLSVILRHKTEYPKYRRAGLVLTQKAESYEITEDQLAALKKDPWVIVGDGKDKKDSE